MLFPCKISNCKKDDKTWFANCWKKFLLMSWAWLERKRQISYISICHLIDSILCPRLKKWHYFVSLERPYREHVHSYEQTHLDGGGNIGAQVWSLMQILFDCSAKFSFFHRLCGKSTILILGEKSSSLGHKKLKFSWGTQLSNPW